ncbi:glucans biosynthesis glucosyltransferase H [Oceaniferula spumae]|uniref:Glucans biosynthesis glucosyltransferase H n=1 Tax=Oceaniferula spumae TaxID=2979115 RepID=A0AAT9FJF7_9BACT
MSEDKPVVPEDKQMAEPVREQVWPTFLFFSIVIVIASLGAYLMADYLWKLGWTFSSTILWVLFTILFSYLSFGFTHAFTGFILRRCGSAIAHMPSSMRNRDEDPEIEDGTRVAVVIPVYNEPVERVFAGIKAILESVDRTAHGELFDFFILSDSTQSEQWIAEQAAWVKLQRETGKGNRIFYRHRPDNLNKKSGNVSDFCRTWGPHYRYMIVLDADSVMSGETMVELLMRMEANPGIGLIQTAPIIVGGESLYGRMQQFSNQLYGPVFMEGLAFWQGRGGNFWGHNAIIRLQPFMEHCELPELPGRKPFGGHILSHDFVEAGLMQRAGWEVWLAQDLGGSFEEGPQGIIEAAQRDQRWCQGNLQHGMLLFAKELRGKTRVHLGNGILCYLSSAIWMLFMIVAMWKAAEQGIESIVPNKGSAEGFVLLGLTMFLLFTAKLFCIIDLALDRERCKGFGGFINACTSSFIETILSALIAPVMMIFYTRFVIYNLIGRSVGWSAQRRGAQGTSWDDAFAAHGAQSLIGILTSILAILIDPILFWWMSPVLIGLVLSIPVSVITSRLDLGLNAKHDGLFLVPVEYDAPREVREALDFEAVERKEFAGLTAAVLDPYLNAVHVSLLRKNRHRLLRGSKVYGDVDESKIPNEEKCDTRRYLAGRLLREGPSSLRTEEIFMVLSDIDSMLLLHREAWLRPDSYLAPWWRRAIKEMSASI